MQRIDRLLKTLIHELVPIIKIFGNKRVRTVWDEEKEEWFFSVVDVVGVLTDSPNPNNYWKVLKTRLKKEAVSRLQIVTN